MRSLLILLATAALLPAAQVTHDIEYVKRGDTPLRLDASVPDGKCPFPAVILIHGGGFERGNKVTYIGPLFQPLTAAHFAWFTIDYRLSPAAKLPDMVDDVLSAMQWLRAHAGEYKVDLKRVALVGESAGAYLADMAAMKAPPETPVAAVVSFYGPHDLLMMVRAHGLSESMKKLAGVSTLDDAGERRMRALSPYYQVREGLPPFLLPHGSADEQVPYEQSPRFCEALKAKGVACELYTVPGARHGMGAWEEHAEQLGYKVRVIEWLREKLR